MLKRLSVFILIGFFIAPGLFAQPQNEPVETRLTVHALAKDAKFIGTSMGGAKVIVRDADSGAILTEGLTSGSTGDTNLLMRQSRERYTSLSTPGTAKFVTSLPISEPKRIRIEVLAPYGKREAMSRVSTEIWLIPGKHIEGDGIVLEVPGFVIDVLSPQTHASHSGSVPIKANITMMCGCPTQDGGLWDSSEYEIRAIIKHNGSTTDQVNLSNTSESTFETTYQPEFAGTYEVIVYAYHPKTGNTGVGKTTFTFSN